MFLTLQLFLQLLVPVQYTLIISSIQSINDQNSFQAITSQIIINTTEKTRITTQ